MLLWDDRLVIKRQRATFIEAVAVVPVWVALLAELGVVALALCLGIWLGSF